jgi:putative ABC transport system permease protein
MKIGKEGFASDFNFSNLMNRPLSKVSSGLIKIKKGADPDKVLKLLKAKFSGGVKVLSMKSYMELEKNYWKNGSPIGSIFTIGTIMGFIVGLVIVYQVLYSEVADNLEYYATLKAIGYGSKYFFKVIIQQSIILSLLGYIPGFLFSVLLYQAVVIIVRLPTQMEFGRAVIVLFLTTVMCSIAGMIATNKLRDGDPADIF